MALVLVIAVVAWAAATVLQPADDPTQATEYTTVRVEPGEVGLSLTLQAAASWELSAVGTNQASGIVTGVAIAPGDEVSQGSVLYDVNERPVVIASGEVPSYRTIDDGAQGEDVAQLQRMLAATGVYSGDIDGRVRWGTTSAIRAWQKAIGVEQTGSVALGDVIFVPTLPVRVSLDPEVIGRGLALGGGEAAIRVLPSAPSFEISATDAQAAAMPDGATVELTAPDGQVWQAIAASQYRDEQSSTTIVTLDGQGGTSICGDTCGKIPVAGITNLLARIVTVPTVAGLVVPSGAIATDADGETVLIGEDGARLPVSVVVSARGMSVVEGVERGTSVRMPASTGVVR